ncbi:MAG: hypothetical protein ACLR6J_18585 [Parabacteroides merdae]
MNSPHPPFDHKEIVEAAGEEIRRCGVDVEPGIVFDYLPSKSTQAHQLRRIF